MLDRLHTIDQSLLDDFQRDFPLVPRPFAEMARRIGIGEDEVIDRLKALQSGGAVTRVGATVRPNTAGASTLAALAVPEDKIDDVAALVGQEDGVNHSYLREHDWNLWFVATAPDAVALNRSLARIKTRSGLPLLDLRLKRPFNIDLGFSLRGRTARPCSTTDADLSVLRESDRPILHGLSRGLALVPRPFAALASQLGLGESALIARIRALCDARLITRIGVIVRHRAVGWSSNAMVVWNLPESLIEAAGKKLARVPGVTLCYQRDTVPGVWPYGLFSMIHARSRPDALTVLARAAALPELAGADHRVLFSTRCFKQTGAQLEDRSEGRV
ncbi:siroheme decarboxylase subunit beta [Marimonas arenosa]|uniref:siroheme decarboxylase n=1 Tax=Marimonas arenosa TaxID=1795305 RepID=A0AAE4B574_9RHOB|nr:Lrp/AsnC family transcriptional regulator [Marimonas arenosa]MDQ2091773.1 Lrp/AsnC family transcriptional regulator [Marimonas arenosa]